MTKNLPAEKARVDEQLPAYLQDTAYVNDDNFDSSDVVIPRIKLIQGLSPEIETFDTAKIGNFWHTGLDMDLGPSFKFVIGDRRKKYLLSAPLADGQGILARADDAKTWDRTGEWQVKLKNVKKPVTWTIKNRNVQDSGVIDWGSSNPEDSDSQPAATLFYDYLVLLPDYPDLGPAVISLARSAIRKAKKGLNDKIDIHATRGRPFQALVFEASSVDDQSDDGPYKNWLFRQAGFNMDESLFNLAMEHKGALGRVKLQDEGHTDDSERASSGGDTGEGKF